MTEETIVAVYDTVAHADLAIADLKQAGVPDSAISRHASDLTGSLSETTVAPAKEEGFWSRLFGGEPDHDTTVYDRSLQSGSTVVTVRAGEQHIDTVMEILESHQPIDIDERAASYGLAPGHASTGMIADSSYTGAAATETNAAADAGKLQLSEEQIAVGKRLVNRGGTRIRRYVVETPVEENVTLRTERVTLERKPVTDGRPLSDGSFSDKVIEMTETAEEAVISKTARVVEEVSLRKEATDRVETVRDTVRKEEVKVEQIPGSASTTTTTTTPVTPKI